MFGSFFSKHQIGKSKKSGDEWFYHEFPIQFRWKFQVPYILERGAFWKWNGGDFLTAFFLGRYDFKLKPQHITKGIDSKSDPQNPGSKSQSEVLHGIQR